MEVILERVPYWAFTGENIGALANVARVLKKGGRLVIETGEDAPLGEVVAELQRLGFRILGEPKGGRVEGIMENPPKMEGPFRFAPVDDAADEGG